MTEFDPENIERCRCCLHRVGAGHAIWCDFYDDEPDWPDEWTEADPEAIAQAEDRYLHSMIGEHE